MPSQAEVVDEINVRTDKLAEERFPAVSGCSRVRFVFRLIFVPSFHFFRGFFRVWRLINFLEGVRSGVNAWAESFILEAKLYEHCYSNKEKSFKDSRDFF